MPNGRFLEQQGSRIVFANPNNRKQTLTSKLQLSQKNVGNAKVENVRFSVKTFDPAAIVVVPDCKSDCIPSTEQLVVELSFSGSALNKAALYQMLQDTITATQQNFDDVMKGWNLSSASEVEFTSPATPVKN